MKKTYISPVMDVDEVKEQTLLASSPKLGGDYVEGDAVLSSEFEDGDWDDFE